MVKKLVILDSGHNEYVKGKEAPDKSLREWIFNNDVQRMLETRCKVHNLDVYLTNPSPAKKDEIGLTKRATLANDYYKKMGKPKTIMISIHANAASPSSARGTETFVASNASSTSKNFAKVLNDNVVKTYRVIDSGAKDRGVKVADHTVTYKAIMATCLFEAAFYSNPADLKLLKNNKPELVEAMMKSICTYFSITYKAPVTEEKPPIAGETETWYRAVVASYTNRVNAEDMVKELKSKSYDSFLEAFKADKGEQWYRVVAGSNKDRKRTEDLIVKLKKDGFVDTFLVIAKLPVK